MIRSNTPEEHAPQIEANIKRIDVAVAALQGADAKPPRAVKTVVPERRATPRYSARVNPVVFLRHYGTVQAWMIECAGTDDPMEFIIEYTGTGKLTGRILFERPGQSKRLIDFLKTLEESLL
jgi:hypothetical protein